MTPDPKLGTQGSWVRDPKNQVLFLPKPYRVGCPSIANRGRWIRFWNQFSCIDDPWPKTGYPGVMGSWPQKPSFVFAETISCWVSFHSKSRSRRFQRALLYNYKTQRCGINWSTGSCMLRITKQSRSFDFHPLLRRLRTPMMMMIMMTWCR